MLVNNFHIRCFLSHTYDMIYLFTYAVDESNNNRLQKYKINLKVKKKKGLGCREKVIFMRDAISHCFHN